jgi:hypothetical protein
MDLIKDTEFKQWLTDLKIRIRQSQIKAMIKVNDEMLRLYWDLGRDIVIRQMDATWGSGFFKNLSKELKAEFPDIQGSSERNLYSMKQFYLFYSQDNKILHQLGAKIQVSKNKIDAIYPQVGDELNIPNFSNSLATSCRNIYKM